MKLTDRTCTCTTSYFDTLGDHWSSSVLSTVSGDSCLSLRYCKCQSSPFTRNYNKGSVSRTWIGKLTGIIRIKELMNSFKSSKNGVLIATDVAARGLDIPLVEHVVHFNLPRTADAYIHRSGRTARAQKPGFALLLCSAEEKGTQRALMKSLGRSKFIT
jgi:superfamily II DNA or RNA helicase